MVVSSGNKPLGPGGVKGGVASGPSVATGPPVPSTVNAASSTAVVSSSESVQQTAGGPAGPPALHQPHEYEVEYHLHQGEVISLQLGDGRVQIIPGKTYIFFSNHVKLIESPIPSPIFFRVSNLLRSFL